MKNIPIFTAAGGTASLILQEIPLRRTAYVYARSWSAETLPALLHECAAFCRMAGAQEVLCTAGEDPLPLPHAYDVIAMAVAAERCPPCQAPVALQPVEPSQAEAFRQIYNQCFAQVPGALTYSRLDAQRVVAQERCFFALQGQELCGMGQLQGSCLRAVGVLPAYTGIGTRLIQSLLAQLPGPEHRLSVSTANSRALRIYARLGFQRTQVESKWYRLE